VNIGLELGGLNNAASLVAERFLWLMFNYVLHTVSVLSAETNMFLEKPMVDNNSFMGNGVHYGVKTASCRTVP
jgi:hypothetical protein